MIDLLPRLSDDQIERIQRATEDIIENTGFKVMHKEALRRAKIAGAIVDEENQIVRIPAALLREVIAGVPSTFTISDIPGNEYVMGDGSGHLSAIITDPWIVDYKTREPRHPNLADIRKHTTVARKLHGMVSISPMDYPATDVSGPVSSWIALEEFILHNDKHLWAVPSSIESYVRWRGLAELLPGEDRSKSPVMTVACAILSPLSLSESNLEMILRACEDGFVVNPTCCPMAGTTAPYSRAGILLQGNVEEVFFAALTQMIKPGSRFFYQFGPSITDMRSGHDLYFTIDKALWRLASIQLARAYGLPVSSESGGSLTYRYDQQNGAEGMLLMLGAVAGQPDQLTGIGSCHNANGMSPEMMIVQTAWLQASKFLLAGMRTDDHRLAVESIKNAGPGGNFLMDELTMEYLRGGEFFSCDILDYSGGYEEGMPMLERAHAKVEELCADDSSPLPHDLQENLRRYFHDRRRDFGQ